MNAVNYKGFVFEQRMLGMSSQGAITTDIISDKSKTKRLSVLENCSSKSISNFYRL